MTPSIDAGDVANEHFGEHITLDGYGGEPTRLNDPQIVHSALLDLCCALQMRALAAPIVLSAPDNLLKDPGGYSGFLVLAESHISIHTFPRRKFLSADAYTCRNGINIETVVDLLSSRFMREAVETNFIRRGLKYPANNFLD